VLYDEVRSRSTFENVTGPVVGYGKRYGAIYVVLPVEMSGMESVKKKSEDATASTAMAKKAKTAWWCVPGTAGGGWTEADL